MGFQIKEGLSPVRKLQLALMALTLLVVGGTAGFVVIEKMNLLEGIYMTVITLSTVGFQEVHPLDTGGRIFVIFLIFFGVGLGGFVATVVGEMILQGQFRELVTRRKMDNAIAKMTDHAILAGYGRVGRQVIKEFEERKVPYVVVERNSDNVNRLLSEGRPHIQGDATDEEVLERAGIHRARTLISTLPDEALNVYLTLTARHMNARLKIIARADFEEGEKKLMRAGANHVVVPHILGGSRMAMASIQPNVVDFMRMEVAGQEGLFVEEVAIPSGAKLVGKTLEVSNINREFGITVVGLRQSDHKVQLNPPSQTVLGVGDVLILIGRSVDLERFGTSLEG